MKYAGYSLVIYFLVVLSLSIGKSAFLRDSTGSLVSVKSTFMGGLIIIMMLAFMIPGVVFGKITNKIKNDSSIFNFTKESLASAVGEENVILMSEPHHPRLKWDDKHLEISSKALTQVAYDYLKNKINIHRKLTLTLGHSL